MFVVCFSHVSLVFVFVFVCLLFSFLSRPLSLVFGRLSLCLSFFLSVCVDPRVSRHTLILTCSDHVQLGPPVDLCVRELSPPLSNVIRRLWCAW